MRKIVVIGDDLFSKEELKSSVIREKFSKLDKFNATYDVSFQKLGENRSQFLQKIENEGPEWVEPDQDVIEKIRDAEIIVTHFNVVNSKMINSAERLKMIGVMRSGVENVSIATARERGVTVVNSPGRSAEPVADYTVALLLAEARHLVRLSSALIRDGKWLAFNPKDADTSGSILLNHTAGIVGFGNIGKKVATRLAAFGTKIIAYDPFCAKEDADKYGVELVPLEHLLKRSDYVLLHARLSEETRNLIGEKEFNLMKPTAIFVNTARGGLVDEAALVKALQERKIRSAALDVFSQEPLPPDHPLLSLDNVTLTPHRSGATGDSKYITVDIMIDQLSAYFAGEPLFNFAE